MPFKTTKLESPQAESEGATRHKMMDDLKGLLPGQAAVGVVGAFKEDTPEPSYVEPLSAKEKAEKAALQNFLMTHVDPPELSQIHPNPVRDRASMVRKISRLTLDELKRIWPHEVPEQPTEEQCTVLQERYKDMSP